MLLYISILMTAISSSICMQAKIPQNTKIAILGDYTPNQSEAATSVLFASDKYQLEKLSTTNNNPSLLKIPSRQYEGGLAWIFSHVIKGVLSTFDTKTDKSWINFLAEFLNIKIENFFIASSFDARIYDLTRQIDTILSNKLQPDLIIIFFNQNNLCAQHPETLMNADNIKKYLIRAIKYFVRNNYFDKKVHLLIATDPSFAIQILDSTEILNKQINTSDKPTTCKEIHKKDPFRIQQQTKNINIVGDNPESQAIMQILYVLKLKFFNSCKTIYDPEGIARESMGLSRLFSSNVEQKIQQNKDDIISKLAGLRRLYEKAEEDAKKEIQVWLENNNKGNFLKLHTMQTSHIIFDKQDLKNCRELSPKGHKKIAAEFTNKIQMIFD
jgi:hypothetical protein